MAFVPAICTQCGKTIIVDDSKDASICSACGMPFIVEKAIFNFNVTQNNVPPMPNNEAEDVSQTESTNEPKALYENIEALLSVGHAIDSETVLKNFSELEEKYAKDVYTDKARWLLKSDEAALIRTFETDNEFFRKYASLIKSEKNILDIYKLDKEIFDQLRHKVTSMWLLYPIKDEYPDIEAKYRALTKKSNDLIKELWGMEFTGEIYNVKEDAYQFIKYIDSHRNEKFVVGALGSNTLWDKLTEKSKIHMQFYRTLDVVVNGSGSNSTSQFYGEDEEFLQALNAWFEYCYPVYIKANPDLKMENVEELLPQMKKKYGMNDATETKMRYRAFWMEFLSLLRVELHSSTNKSEIWSAERAAYQYLDNAKYNKNAPINVIQICNKYFKKGFLSTITFLGNRKEMTVEKLVEESI